MVIVTERIWKSTTGGRRRIKKCI